MNSPSADLAVTYRDRKRSVLAPAFAASLALPAMATGHACTDAKILTDHNNR